MKFNCNRCLALYGSGLDQKCILGYKIRFITKSLGTSHFSDSIRFMKLEMAIPDEECPKPMTNKQFLSARKKE